MAWRSSLRDLRVQVIQESRRFTLRTGNVLSSQWNKVRRFIQESKSSSSQTQNNQGIVNNGDQSTRYVNLVLFCLILKYQFHRPCMSSYIIREPSLSLLSFLSCNMTILKLKLRIMRSLSLS